MDLRPFNSRWDEFTNEAVDVAAIKSLSKQFDIGKCTASKTKTVSIDMKAMNTKRLTQFLNISDSLATVALQYWKDFNADITESSDDMDFKPACYTFTGPAFEGLDPSTCDMATLQFMGSQLYILDPVYGVLRCLQGMQPYRLDMGTGLFITKNGDKRQTLAAYWKQDVTLYLGKELMKNVKAAASVSNWNKTAEGGEGLHGPILANLASEEFSSSINPRLLPRNTIYLNIVFKHRGRVVVAHGNRARGSMARFIAERHATTLQHISEFNWEGYECIPFDNGGVYKCIRSLGENVRMVKMVFDRDEAPLKEESAATKRPDRIGSQ
jgi:cytoplasmic iron level regulating protein YaaA (DUF328/UPF0246 family)